MRSVSRQECAADRASPRLALPFYRTREAAVSFPARAVSPRPGAPERPFCLQKAPMTAAISTFCAEKNTGSKKNRKNVTN